MPVTFFTGDETREQAVGPVPNSGFVQIYAVRRSDPRNLIYLGGHRIDDAPTYNLTEAKISPEYRHNAAGRNVVIERQIVGEAAKSVQMTINLPNRVLSVVDRLYQSQDAVDLDYVFIPASCDDGCDEWFWVGEDGKLGVAQITSSPVGFDENEGPITRTRTLTVSGNLRTYLGMEQSLISDQTEAMYAVELVEDPCEDASEDPYQRIYIGGATGALYSTSDGGGTWTQIDTATNSLNTHTITDLLYSDGAIIFVQSDTPDGTNPTTPLGGAGYSVGDGAAVASNFFDLAGASETPTGLQAIVKAFAAIYVFGSNGTVWRSTDSGVNFYRVAVPAGLTATILAAELDDVNNIVYLALEGGEAWTFDGAVFQNITTAVNPTAAVDLVSVAVTGDNMIAFGGANGNVYESFDGGSTWQVTADLGANPVHALVGDDFNMRMVGGHGTVLSQRDAFRKQVFENVPAGAADAPSGNFTAGHAGPALLDEGVNYFVFVTDTGEVVTLANCNLGIDG